MLNDKAISSSFRDPSGHIFLKNGKVYRMINNDYRKDFSFFIESGLYKLLVEKKLIVSHKEIKGKLSQGEFKIILPEQIPFITYPYEWSFSQLKEAALVTLEIQKLAISRSMYLKDANAFNIQFIGSRPVLIDTLSFERFNNKPWIAYRQFCQHFLAPLALMSLRDLRLNSLSQIHLDGVPLELTTKLLPFKARFKLGLLTHLFLHSSSQKKYANQSNVLKKIDSRPFTKEQLLAINDSLISTVKSLVLPKQITQWGNYYKNTNYKDEAYKQKKKIISDWLDEVNPNSVWDVGSNDGTYSLLSSDRKIMTLASDIDPIAVDIAYQNAKKRNEKYLLPLVIDLTNPTPSIGWSNEERNSFMSRVKFDLTLCLAFIHHLTITNNLPLIHIAKLFSKHTNKLIIEFVPKSDSNTQRLLANRKDVFPNYTQLEFEKMFSVYFKIIKKKKISLSERTLYLMVRKVNA